MWKVLERLYDKLTEIFRKIIVPSVPEYLFGCGVNQQVHVVVGKSRQYSNLQTKWYHKLSSHACMWVSHPHFVLSLIFLLSFPFLLVGLSFLARSKSLSLSCYRCIFVSLIPSDNHFKEVSTFMLACSMIFWLLWYPLRPTLDQASTTRKVYIFEQEVIRLLNPALEKKELSFEREFSVPMNGIQPVNGTVSAV